MKSKANLKGHPIHPMLVGFPIAFFTGTLFFEFLYRRKREQRYRDMANMLELGGIISGLAAAVPGIIDYFYTIPPDSSAKKRGTQHGMLNVGMLALFTTALAGKKSRKIPDDTTFLLEITGIGLICVTGWLGGTLVYRNQIGVYNRYADLGKWKETYLGNRRGKIEVAEADELEVNQMKLLHVNNKRIVLAKIEEGYVAFDDSCTHKGGSLAGGMLICGAVQCPWHGSQFNVKTGAVKAGPATKKIETYKISEEDGKIMLSLS